MNNFIQDRTNAALTLCAVASAMLYEAHYVDVAKKLNEIRKELDCNNLQNAFDLYRFLPRGDIAGFWEDWDWMEEEAQRTPLEQKALFAAYYQRTLEALGDLRVTVLYGRNRAIVYASSESILKLAKKMVEEISSGGKA
ncbi:hypothetical protein OU994_14565 [Pseudoduganella sp. SL102]|uniref:hypothetical protein n=1 Tax=Pseudoduganella sp. SL102 TaxID=2995154 RepID=UPI00248AE3B6|nr:hypothetical protein [Pseudoduganella sp. SL102]WBS05409.1 hypothetical protein OU994_14565 [Pseudoduganella sp. SL102]